MEAIFKRHEKCVLQLSGGKDSLACLHLCRPWWDKITVMWCNTGAAFAETLMQMAAIEAMVPHFLEVKSDQPADVAAHGYPVDVLPIRSTTFGQALQPNQDLRLQAFITCCHTSIWAPLERAVKTLGATLVIRGQRLEDKRKAPIVSGHIEDGIEYLFPLESWSTEEVMAYLKREDVDIPRQYGYFTSSLDCWDCTAYLDDNIGKVRFMKAHYPELAEQHVKRLRHIQRTIASETVPLIKAIQAHGQ